MNTFIALQLLLLLLLLVFNATHVKKAKRPCL